jgi:hypothetical protein
MLCIDYSLACAPVDQFPTMLICCSRGSTHSFWSQTEVFFSNFDMKDFGEAPYVLGIEIHRDRKTRVLGLSQKAYLDEKCSNTIRQKMFKVRQNLEIFIYIGQFFTYIGRIRNIFEFGLTWTKNTRSICRNGGRNGCSRRWKSISRLIDFGVC